MDTITSGEGISYCENVSYVNLINLRVINSTSFAGGFSLYGEKYTSTPESKRICKCIFNNIESIYFYGGNYCFIFITPPDEETIILDKLKSVNFGCNAGGAWLVGNNKGVCKKYIFPICTYFRCRNEGWTSNFITDDYVEEIYCPNLSYIRTENNHYGITYILSCSKLKKFIIGKVTTFYNVKFSSYNLIHLEFGEDIEINIDLRYWNPVNCINKELTDLIENPQLFNNNIEQFLYNFRVYIIDKFHSYYGGTKHTLTLLKKYYDIVLGLDTEGYANTFHMPDEPSIDYVTSLNQKLTDINWGLAYV